MSVFLDDRAPVGPIIASLLRPEPSDWRPLAEDAIQQPELLAELADYVDRCDSEVLYQSVLSAYGEGVEPRVFTAICTPELQLAVNLFPPPSVHNRLIYERIVGPHTHERSFVSRVLVGGYSNLIYRVVREGTPPVLELEHHERREAGSVCFMHYATYHSVLSPTAGTMSIVARGPIMAERDIPPAKSYTREAFRAHREEVLGRLAPILTVGTPAP